MNTSSTTTTNKDDDDTNTSLTLANASRFPLMRRVDQHFTLQSKLENYGEEISRVSDRNKTALASLGSQERRIREMQALLRGESSSSDEHQVLDTNNDISQQHHVQNDTTTENDNDTLVRQSHQSSMIYDSSAVESDNIIATSSVIQITSVPSPLINFRITQISHDSFTAVWDTNNGDQQTIVDYEIKYSHSTSSIEGEGGDDQRPQVQISCSRWCMKQPLPSNGRHLVENLQPNTRYNDIAIRCRSSVGWSEFSNSINSITTTSKDENHDKRRKRFLYRIGHMEQNSQSLEVARQKLPAEQVLLARNMSRMQDRIDKLDSEIERVTSLVGNDLLSSHLLHGAEQVRYCC